MNKAPIEPKDILPILKRRKKALILPALAIILVSVIVALRLPAYYRSSATILIEEQEIPQDFVMTTVTSFAEQRLEVIKQRIMGHVNLLSLINKQDLYTELRDKKTSEEIVAIMRKNIQVSTISAEVMDRRTGRPTTAMIAFQLSYEGQSPAKVLATTNALASLFLEENLKERTKKSEETTQFLEDEMNKVKTELRSVQARISSFKERNMMRLPEFANVNMQFIASAEKNSENLVEQLKILTEKEKYLSSQLAMTSPNLEFNSDQRRLEELKVQLVNLKTKFSDQYPDVINTKAEIERLTRQLEAVKPAGSKRQRPDNPAYITLSSQLSSLRSEIDSVKRQLNDIKTKKQQYESRIGSSAQIEGQYKDMLAEQANLESKLNDLTQKTMDAKVASGLEKDQKGERFTLIEPPRLPERPFKPNRLAIVMIGIVLATGVGIGFAAVTEFLDDAIHSPSALTRTTQIPVLGEIPAITTMFDLTGQQTKHHRVLIGILIAAACGLLAFHFFVMDLGMFWAKLLMKAS